MNEVSLVRPEVSGCKKSAECPLEIARDASNYRIQMDLPGLRKQDIQVCVDGRRVDICTRPAEPARPRERTAGNTSAFARSIVLDDEIDSLRALAIYRCGRLELMLPIRSAGQPTRLIVN